MRTHPILLLVLGLTSAACQDGAGPSPTLPPVGTLVVVTTSGGNDPEQSGYLLTVDGADSHPLHPTGTSRIDLPAGPHTLRLTGMAEHCSVSPATSLRVAVPPGDTTSVAFEVICSVTGVRITTTTTGLDFDPDGYRVAVDGIERGAVSSNGAVLTRSEPGSRMIALTGFAPNCTLDGPDSRAVTIVADTVVPVEFAVMCTSTSGVIGVVVSSSGTDTNGRYEARVDGSRPFSIYPSRPGYLTAVPAGDHVVSLVTPVDCSVETAPQRVIVTAGTLIRDTVEVTFSVVCEPGYATVRITAPTMGQVPKEPYQVAWCEAKAYPIMCLTLGRVAPPDTLVARVRALDSEMWLHLRNIPATCSGGDPIGIRLGRGDTRDVVFRVTCST
jgi:hypothetical protein